MSKNKIFFKVIWKYFLFYFIVYVFAFSLLNLLLDVVDIFSEYDTSNYFETRTSFFISLLMTVINSFSFYKKIKLNENEIEDATQYFTSELKISKEEFISQLEIIYFDSVIQNEESYIKIYKYSYSSSGILIFITFENDNILVTTRGIFDKSTSIKESEKNMLIINGLVG